MVALINKNSGNLSILLLPKSGIVPHAVLDKYGNEVTDICNIQNAYLDEFRYCLRQREIPLNLNDYEKIQNLLCHLRLKICQGNISPDFTMQELSTAISELKNGKCTDPHGFTKEIFKGGGKDLTLSILKMVNKIKNTKDCPSV